MPSEICVRLYEVGVRLTQSIIAFPEASEFSEDLLVPAARDATLARLRHALLAANRTLGEELVHSHDLERLSHCRELWRRGPLDCYPEFPTALDTLRLSIEEAIATHESLSTVARDWYRLGREIANGSGEPSSEGPLSLRDGRIVRLGPGTLATWDWQNETHVRELLDRLGADEQELFPWYPQLSDEDWARLPGIHECFWGWSSIECGITFLSSQMHHMQVCVRGDESVVVIGGVDHPVSERQALTQLPQRFEIIVGRRDFLDFILP